MHKSVSQQEGGASASPALSLPCAAACILGPQASCLNQTTAPCYFPAVDVVGPTYNNSNIDGGAGGGTSKGETEVRGYEHGQEHTDPMCPMHGTAVPFIPHAAWEIPHILP